jgi:hypothetical protein
MNTDPLLVGVNSVFPNQNLSTAPTAWEEDTDQGAQQGIPSVSGPMLTLRKRSNNLPVLPNGAVNPAPEPDPVCMIVDNLRMNAGVAQRLPPRSSVRDSSARSPSGGQPARPA